KIKTALDLIVKSQAIQTYKVDTLFIEDSLLAMSVCGVAFLFVLGIVIWTFFILNASNKNVCKLEALNPSENSRLAFSKTVIALTKIIVAVTVVFGVIQTGARPVYNWIVSGKIDYICFQKYFIASTLDVMLHLVAIIILYMSVPLFDSSFTSQQGGFLITDDNRIIKYKGKDKVIFVPQLFKIFMTDTFEDCDASYVIHFEEGTKEVPPLKFKKSIPTIQYPSSLTDIREYSLFVKNKNPYDNSLTVNTLLKNPVFKIIDGCMVNTKSNTLLFKIEHNATEFKIPDGITKIGKYAFDDLLLGKAYATDDTQKSEIEERIKKYINFTNNGDTEFESFAPEAAKNRVQLTKVSFNKGITSVNPEALEMATGVKEIFVPEDCGFDFSEINPFRPYIKFLGKGKKITHRMIERLLHIHAKIKSGCYPNAKQLAYDLETSEPTINRDIEYLRDSRGAPIQYDFTNRGYYYTEDYELFFDK
ncbi:MAG: leucine-rich repeat protein, partial [Treponema sp.]|nr:leucine-rich repeat protein [Treponema sp.]